MENSIIHFDLETTGVSVSKDRIVQLSAIKTDLNLNIIDKKKILVNPTMPIPKEASEVHNITDEMVKDCPTFSQYAKNIYLYFKDSILSGYNIKNFDIPLLVEEFLRCNLQFDLNNIKIIDSCNIFKEKESRNLTAALKFYRGEEMIGAHDAENDVLATIKILDGQMFMYGMSIEDCFDKNKDNFVDFAGKIVLNSDNIPCYNFGKSKGVPVKEDFGFGEWMLRNDFTLNTKNVVKSILYGK